jgi:hypothetical protein
MASRLDSRFVAVINTDADRCGKRCVVAPGGGRLS